MNNATVIAMNAADWAIFQEGLAYWKAHPPQTARTRARVTTCRRPRSRTRGAGRPATRRTSRSSTTGSDGDGGGGPSDEPPALRAALDLHQRGFSLIPLAADGTKRPNYPVLIGVFGTPRWGHLKEEAATCTQIEEMFRIDPRTNIGVILRPGQAVIDVDDVDRFAGLGYDLPHAPRVKSSRGFHVYCTGRVPTRIGVRAGDETVADILGTGCIVAVPPSTHASGRSYEWLVEPQLVDPPPLPDWARELVDRHAERNHRPVVSLPRVQSKDSADRIDLAQFTMDPKAVDASMRVMGRPGAIDLTGRCQRDFRCVLPGHRDLRKSATMWRSYGTGAYRYRCRGCGASMTLAQLYASCTAGRVVHSLRTGSARIWLLRLLHEARVRTVDVLAVDLPSDVSQNAKRAADLYVLLNALRADDAWDGPIPYARGFIADWCGMTRDQARSARDELTDAGWLRLVDVPPKYGVGHVFEPKIATQPHPSDDAAAGLAVVADPDRTAPLKAHHLAAVVLDPDREGDDVVVMPPAEVVTVDCGTAAPSGGARSVVALLNRHADERTPRSGGAASASPSPHPEASGGTINTPQESAGALVETAARTAHRRDIP